jgi:hypothetical protein
VAAVRADSRSGSVLIEHEPAVVEPEMLFAAVVRLLGLEQELDKPVQPAVAREMRAAVDSLNRAVLEKSGGLIDFWSALFIVLAAVGVKKLVSEGGSALPAGFTLLWWGMNAILRGRPG